MPPANANPMICSYCKTPLPEHSRFCLVCGADLSDPEVSTRQRAVVKELFEELKRALKKRYRVTDILGRGGMGAVFLAEDLRLGRRVAIKVLRPELAGEPGFLGRFEREARISAQLDHPNIIPIYEVAQEGELHYFVMKHVAGKSLDELLAGKPMPVEQARPILWQAACGLGHAHARGVIHRDVKPSNIMVDETGRVIITDFGISKAIQSSTQYTSTGQVLGTPRYVSPEQVQALPLDGRSDQYSLAVVGYQMMVGRLPLIAETVHALMYKHIYETPVPAATVSPEIPGPVSDSLQRALAKEPEQRFPSMEDFATALWPERPARAGEPQPVVAISGGAQASRPDEAAASLPLPARGRRLALMTGGLIVLAVLGLGVVTLTHRRERGESTMHSIDTVTTARAPTSEPPAEEPRAAPEPATVPAPGATGLDSMPSAPRESTARVPLPPPPTPKGKPARRRPGVSAVRPSPADTQIGPSPVVAPKTGYLTVNAIPYGTVSIDGVEIGDTPVVRHEVPPGAHRISIVREGFRTDSTVATVTPGNEVRLSRTLMKENR